MHLKNRNLVVSAVFGSSLRISARPIESIPATSVVTASVPEEVWVTASVTIIEDDGLTVTATAVESDGAILTATNSEEDGSTFMLTNTEEYYISTLPVTTEEYAPTLPVTTAEINPTLPVTTAEHNPIITATASGPVTESPEDGSTNIVQGKIQNSSCVVSTCSNSDNVRYNNYTSY
jgi:hypothetical protein